MAGPSWLVDGNRIATKIKSASATCDSEKTKWQSNPCRSCPNCHYIIDNSDVVQEWPGLPRGVKFDPTDQEIIQHLLAKSGTGNEKPHPFISEFIPTVDKEDGICYTHPCNLPGVKQDGSASHFFHRAIKAYNTGTRKRRKIHGDDVGDVRWHKTGRTKPVFVNGVQKGCKKIMVLYMSTAKGGKAEKTNWVMHQYHLGTQEDEKDGECVISKVFRQQQQIKQGDKNGEDASDVTDDVVVRVDPVTPKSVTPEPPLKEMQGDPIEEVLLPCADPVVQDEDMGYAADEFAQIEETLFRNDDNSASDNPAEQALDHDNNEIESQENLYMVNSQQLIAGLQLCADFLQSQSPERDDNVDVVVKKKSVLSEYAHLGSDVLKKDLEDCVNLDVGPSNADLDTQPEFRLSQLDFCSQESYSAWGGSKLGDE
ncbi:SUPPRESSOR OF GAMMA RESPONSE 1 [Silene latifolia]|uniref:SUPPRESSOR OF GAMMA RESPONSE 1 n=1 Tax=Silene latifolia TaxID=37657 RepID=UPI003D772A68